MGWGDTAAGGGNHTYYHGDPTPERGSRPESQDVAFFAATPRQLEYEASAQTIKIQCCDKNVPFNKTTGKMCYL